MSYQGLGYTGPVDLVFNELDDQIRSRIPGWVEVAQPMVNDLAKQAARAAFSDELIQASIGASKREALVVAGVLLFGIPALTWWALSKD